jgi:hypothetical protein
MSLRRAITLSLGALLLAKAAAVSAQEPAPAPQAQTEAPQGYVAPAASSPAAAPAPTSTPAAATPAPAAAAPAAAPAPAAPAAAAAAPSPAAADIGAQLGFVDVLPTRPPERIKALMENAVVLERDAGVDLANAQSEKAKTKALIEAKKSEISIIDGKRKAAEKGKQEAEKVAFEAEKKDAERHKAFLEKRADLHDAEVERAKALQKMAAASTRALQLEQELGSRRAARGTTGGDPAAARRQDAVIVELEGRTLEAKRVQAEAQKSVADKDVDLARRRLELHKAQTTAAGTASR